MSSDSKLPPASEFPDIQGLAVVEPIGSGAFSRVFKATQQLLERTVALKIMKLESLSAESLSRFQTEAKICSTLDHPGMARVFSYGITGDGTTPYMVMEYCPGRTLASHLQAKESFSGHQICSITLQLIDVLRYAHSMHVIHRDLKPENIMLRKTDGDYQVKLLDFGIARLLEGEMLQGTKQTKFIGSPAYMSPEQCSAKPVDERSDVYALGAVLYELIFGRQVFEESAGSLEMLYRKCNERASIDRSEKIRATLGNSMLDLLERSLSIDPSERPQNMEEFKSLFVRAMGEMQELSAQGILKSVSVERKSKGSLWILSILLLVVSIPALMVFHHYHSKVDKLNEPLIDKPAKPSPGKESRDLTIKLADESYSHGDFESARSGYKHALGLFTNNAGAVEKIQILLQLASCEDELDGNLTKQYCQQAEQLARSTKDGRLLENVLYNSAEKSKDKNVQKRLLKEALELYDNGVLPLNDMKALIYNKLAEIAKIEDNRSLAVNYYRRAEEVMLQVNGGPNKDSLRYECDLTEAGYREHSTAYIKEIMSLSKGIEDYKAWDDEEIVGGLLICSAYIADSKLCLELLRKAEKIADDKKLQIELKLEIYSQLAARNACFGNDKEMNKYVDKILAEPGAKSVDAIISVCESVDQEVFDKVIGVLHTAIAKWQAAPDRSGLLGEVRAYLELAKIEREQGKNEAAIADLHRCIDTANSLRVKPTRYIHRAEQELAELTSIRH